MRPPASAPCGRAPWASTSVRSTGCSTIGAGTINPTLNQGQLSIVLKDRGDRDGLDALLPRLQHAVAGIPGVALYLKPVQDVTLDSRVSDTEYQYALSDT